MSYANCCGRRRALRALAAALSAPMFAEPTFARSIESYKATDGKDSLSGETSLSRVQRVVANSYWVVSGSLEEELVRNICGPAALFSTLRGTRHLPEDISLESLVRRLDAQGLFSNRALGIQFRGMTIANTQKALEGFGIPGEANHAIRAEPLAEKLFDAVESGRLVFIGVRSDLSYEAITGRRPEFGPLPHMVSAVAARRGPGRTPAEIFLYDSNVYNHNSCKRGAQLQFMPYKRFMGILGMMRYFVMPQPYLISRQPVILGDATLPSCVERSRLLNPGTKRA